MCLMKLENMSEFYFKSSVCTDKNQSERLLALGLKKETADCYLFEYEKGKYKVIVEPWEDLIADEEYYLQYKDICFPAWSLYRLLAMLTTKRKVMLIRFEADLYDVLIDKIEHEIKEGYFNKEYLV